MLVVTFYHARCSFLPCSYRVASSRQQMNEYRVMMLSLGLLMLTVIVFNVTAGKLAADSTMVRRVALGNNVVRSALLFWPVIATPLWKYLRKDVRYAELFTVGLAPAVTPAMLRYVKQEKVVVCHS